MKIQAFFWDYDNTILETAWCHWNKHVIVLKRHGISLKEEFRKKVYENNGIQNWEWMRDEFGLKIPQEEYLKEVDAEFRKHMNQLEMRPGINKLFDLITEQNIPQAIITNARRDSAEPVLFQKGILSKMNFILYKEDYQGRKPDPAPYLEGFKRMELIIGSSIVPSRCIAIEDDPKGVESAHKAGATVVHRKIDEREEDCIFADYCCFHEHDFIAIIRSLLNK